MCCPELYRMEEALNGDSAFDDPSLMPDPEEGPLGFYWPAVRQQLARTSVLNELCSGFLMCGLNEEYSDGAPFPVQRPQWVEPGQTPLPRPLTCKECRVSIVMAEMAIKAYTNLCGPDHYHVKDCEELFTHAGKRLSTLLHLRANVRALHKITHDEMARVVMEYVQAAHEFRPV